MLVAAFGCFRCEDRFGLASNPVNKILARVISSCYKQPCLSRRPLPPSCIYIRPKYSQIIHRRSIFIRLDPTAPAITTLPVTTTKTLPDLFMSLPSLPEVPGTEPGRCVLDSFRISIAKRVADALGPPLTVEKVYEGVDYGKKGVDFTIALPRFRLPGKIDDLAKKVTESVSVDSCIVCFERGRNVEGTAPTLHSVAQHILRMICCGVIAAEPICC